MDRDGERVFRMSETVEDVEGEDPSERLAAYCTYVRMYIDIEYR